MFTIYANSNQIAHGVKKYIVDTEAEIAEVPTTGAPGSIAFCIDSSKYYMLNNAKEWVETPGLAGGGGSGFDPTALYAVDGGNIGAEGE